MLLLVVLLPGFASRVGAGGECDPEFVHASVSADTILVEHRNTLKNCCLDLTVNLTVEDGAVEFREGDVGSECDCICCFDHRYEAHGIPPGHHVVRVWVDDRLAGEVEVDVEGQGKAGALGESVQGNCVPAAVDPPARQESWGRVRSGFR
jgi:hypothetical protein